MKRDCGEEGGGGFLPKACVGILDTLSRVKFFV